MSRQGAAPPIPVPAHAARGAGSAAELSIATVFAATLVLAAVLLFTVQPLFAKRVLPVLGGTPMVWSIATVVFQVLLLGGYAYAHALTRWLRLRTACLVHAAVLAAGFAVLPVAIARGFDAPPADGEALWLVALFVASVGPPFFALSASAPLLQAWFAHSGDGRGGDPYFLYRASNAGSFAALVAYPLLVEPLLGLDAQARVWSAGYAALAVAILGCGLCVLSRQGAAPVRAEAGAAPAASTRLAWIGLSAVPSGLLVAATAHISTDVAAIPLLWVAPLALYLLSFVAAFRPGAAWPGRALAILQVAGTTAVLGAMAIGRLPLLADLGVSLGLLLVNALIAHRAAYALRPHPGRLTEFYLCTSFGGALGGLFAALIAPQVISSIAEYPILLVAALACRPGALRRAALPPREGRRIAGFAGLAAGAAALAALVLDGRPWLVVTTAGLLFALAASWRAAHRALVAGGALGALVLAAPTVLSSGVERHRSFFGVHALTVSEDGRFRVLSHGTTVHGAMRLREEDGTPARGRPEPTTYYAAGGPIADVLEVARRAGGPLPAVGVVGLGTGSLACHARPGEAWTFYEIDPTVIRIARDPARFRFLSECAPDARIVQGDARLTLARDGAKARVLIVDAFSSDAIPLHLLTREAFSGALAHLDPRGVLAFHITNRHFELGHVLARVAAEQGLTLLLRTDGADPDAFRRTMRAGATVALVSRDPAALREAERSGWRAFTADPTRTPWSDDYANAIEAMIDRVRGHGLRPAEGSP